MGDAEFRYSDLLPTGKDDTPYRLITTEGAGGAGWRTVLVLILVGAVVGFGWGIADRPTYRATATVVVESDDRIVTRVFETIDGKEVKTMEVVTVRKG